MLLRTSKPRKVWEPFPGAQQRFMSCPVSEVLLHGSRGGGKSQPLNCKILTPKGWLTMGDMKVGSRICNPDGTTSTVIGVFPQGKLMTYKISFVGGGHTYCSGDHLWLANVSEFKLEKFFRFGEVYTTEQLIELSKSNFVFIPDGNFISKNVKSITPWKILPCQCIKVNNPNSLYITDDFIVTHNTDVLIMDFLQGIGKGYGIDYKGLILREATTELGDIITKSKKWIPQIFPDANFHSQRKIWTFKDGETLWFNYARVEDDYWAYHGHSYVFIGFEELTNWPLPNIYLKMMSCLRTTDPNIQLKYRSTCNPSGVGHQWVKDRFINAGQPETIIYDENGQARTHIQSSLEENLALKKADPHYRSKLLTLTQDNKQLRDAWVFGSWDLLSGGFFSDVWDSKIHIINPFDVPKSWKLVRSFDWGSSKPWCVSYGFEANGEQPRPLTTDPLPYIPKGSVIVPTEIYGWNGEANKGDMATTDVIAARVKRVDEALRLEYGVRPIAGPADNAIWEVRDGKSIGGELRKFGCIWTKSYKGSGSRSAGWAIIRQMLGAAKRGDLETPHLYFFPSAQHHVRTIPVLQRDKVNQEDINSDMEDHAADSLRYLLSRKLFTMKARKVSH